MAGRLDYETRQRIRRAVSAERRSRARNAARIERELEDEMTITAQIMCTCGHPHRQHAFGAGCTLGGCGCERFTLDEGKNGNGHQADGRDALARMDNGEPPRAAKPAEREDKPAEPLHCKRPGSTNPLRPGSATRGAWVLCEQHYGEQRTKLSRSQLASNEKRGVGRRHERAAETESSSLETGSRPDTRPPAPPPQPAAELAPAAPPPAVPQTDGAIELTSVSLRLGDWDITRYEDGCHTIELDGLVLLEEVPQETLAELTTLLATAAQAFGDSA